MSAVFSVSFEFEICVQRERDCSPDSRGTPHRHLNCTVCPIRRSQSRSGRVPPRSRELLISRGTIILNFTGLIDVRPLSVMSRLQCGRCHTPETQVVGSRANFTFTSCSDHVAGAILIGAEKGSSAMNLLRLARFGGIERRIRPLRIPCHTLHCR